MKKFQNYLIIQGKSKNTVESYNLHIKGYIKWFNASFDKDFYILYRENVLDYISYLTILKNQSPSTINAKLSALMKFNEWLIEVGIQKNLVILKQDKQKIQAPFVSPSKFGVNRVESFRQTILENETKRDYAIVTLMAYTGVRISEALGIKLTELNLTTKEGVVQYGKGNKQRMIFINDKIVNAVRTYLKERDEMVHAGSEYLFISRESGTVHRSIVNKLFKKHSDLITPKELRHFFCSHALDNGWTIHEVAAQVGHSTIQVTTNYTHPSRDKMKDKANKL